MRASNPYPSIPERCGRQCAWPAAGASAAVEAGPRRPRRARVLLPARSDVRTPLQSLLRARCPNAGRLLMQAQCVHVLVIVVPRPPVLH